MHSSYGTLIFATHGPLILLHKSIYVCRYSMFNWCHTISKSTKHINSLCHLLFIICVILQTKWQARTFCYQFFQVFFSDTIFETWFWLTSSRLFTQRMEILGGAHHSNISKPKVSFAILFHRVSKYSNIQSIYICLTFHFLTYGPNIYFNFFIIGCIDEKLDWNNQTEIKFKYEFYLITDLLTYCLIEGCLVYSFLQRILPIKVSVYKKWQT